MKRFFALLLAALMVFSLFACGNTEENRQRLHPSCSWAMAVSASHRKHLFR